MYALSTRPPNSAAAGTSTPVVWNPTAGQIGGDYTGSAWTPTGAGTPNAKMFGAGAGGPGGYIDASDNVYPGLDGGTDQSGTAGGAGGAAGGGAGTAASPDPAKLMGGPGNGGGGASSTSAGGAGAGSTALRPGCGGGGGGASLNGFNSGAGGAGGNGMVAFIYIW